MAQRPVPIALAGLGISPESIGLGPNRLPDGSVTFAVHAPAATRVLIEFYDEPWGADAIGWHDLAQDTQGRWWGCFEHVPNGTLYAFRCWGKNWPSHDGWSRTGSAAGFVSDIDAEGNRFNPNKALFDPYGPELTHNVYSDVLPQHGHDDGIFGTGPDDYRGRPRREVDSGPWVPKSIVVFDTSTVSPKPRTPAHRSIIYETHLVNLTKHPSVSQLHTLLGDMDGFDQVVNIPPPLRGTYQAAGMMAPYLKALGVTAVEFLPIHQTNNSATGRPGKSNHWGYQTLSFFAPNKQYAADPSPGGPTREFKEMVSAFHDAGIEVYLDVVYNHTAEGGVWNGDVNTTGFVTLGGFATAEYYSMTSDFVLIDGATGTANQMNQSSPVTRQLVLDSLRYWTEQMGVDGFRFDLATVLGRLPDEASPEDWASQKRFFPNHPLLTDISAYAHEQHIEVIAEAWDLWGYEVGNFPQGWSEWNGRFRDAMRHFLKGDGNIDEFMRQFNADYDAFHDQGGPHRSINFITAHDGFTLADVVSYAAQDNTQPWPFGPSDGGTDDNVSWDSGGDHALRRQRIRNFVTVLMFARGVPMIVSGDEYGRTQNGNNNPWSLNTVGMWNNYRQAATNAPGSVPVSPDDDGVCYHDNLGVADSAQTVNPLLSFCANVLHLRRAHPSLQSRHWGDLLVGNEDTTYLFAGLDGEQPPAPGDRFVQIHIDSPDEGFVVAVNMWDHPVNVSPPPSRHGHGWRVLIDTSARHESVGNVWPETDGEIVESAVEVESWSVVVLHCPEDN